MEEGKELLITVKDLTTEDGFEKAMQEGTIDCEQLIKDIYEIRRLYSQGSEVKL